MAGVVAVPDLFVTMSSLSDCICAALKAERASGTSWAGECCVWPGGQVAFDSCCETGGQSWVVMRTGYPTTTFPNPDVNGIPACDGITRLAVVIEVGVIRCVCSELCDCSQKKKDARAITDDFAAMLRGIHCCFEGSGPGCSDKGWRLQNFAFIGPEGGCAGSTINIIVEEPFPCC